MGSGRSKTLKLKPKNDRDAREIARALKGGAKAKATVTVRLSDAAGNEKTHKLSLTLRP